LDGANDKPNSGNKKPDGIAQRIIRHPVAMLGGTSILGIAFSLVQFSVALKLLAPIDFAVIGVLLAAGAFVVNFVDVRLVDLTTKLFNDVSDHGPDTQIDVLRAGLLVQARLALVAFAMALAVVYVAGTWLLTRPLHWSWIVAAALTPATTMISSTLSAYLRLLGAFNSFSMHRLVGQILQTGIVSASLILGGTAGTYVLAVSVSAVLILGLAWLWVLNTARSRLGQGFADRRPTKASINRHTSQTRFLAAGSGISFAKMVTRTGDVLLIAALSNEVTTGLYRVARQAADAVYALADAINQFYGPTIVAALSRNDLISYRHLRGRVIALALAMTAAGLGLSLFVLPYLVEQFAAQHTGAIAPFSVFMSALILLVGVHSWLWPALVASGRIGRFGIASLAGAATQIILLLALARTGHLSATTAAGSYLAGLVIVYLPLLATRFRKRL
jgi:O-antigen/teichoic acid export membrane protein